MDSGSEYDYEELFENLLEKRAATREAAYQNLIKGFSFNFKHEFIAKNQLGLTEAIKKKVSNEVLKQKLSYL